jgi:hypothetical protein
VALKTNGYIKSEANMVELFDELVSNFGVEILTEQLPYDTLTFTGDDGNPISLNFWKENGTPPFPPYVEIEEQ